MDSLLAEPQFQINLYSRLTYFLINIDRNYFLEEEEVRLAPAFLNRVSYIGDVDILNNQVIYFHQNASSTQHVNKQTIWGTYWVHSTAVGEKDDSRQRYMCTPEAASGGWLT